MLEQFIINDNWYVEHDCLYCRNLRSRPILRLDGDSYLVNLDVSYIGELKKIIQKKKKLDKQFFFVKNFAKTERRLLNLNKLGKQIIIDDVENAIRVYILNEKMHDYLINLDYFDILAKYIIKHNVLLEFNVLYNKLKAELINDEWVNHNGSYWLTHKEPIIKRIDIQQELLSLGRSIQLSTLL